MVYKQLAFIKFDFLSFFFGFLTLKFPKSGLKVWNAIF